jgi:hypothetical protein
MSMEDELKELDIAADPQIKELQKIISTLQRQLAQAKQKTDAYVDATYRGAFDAMYALGPIPPVPEPPAHLAIGKPEWALAVGTDWQGSKKTTTYNTAVMKRRVMQFGEKVVRLAEIQAKDHPIEGLVLALGGDLIEGLFNYSAQLWQIDASLHEQWETVALLLVDLVRYFLAHFQKVVVVSEWGNHGRIGSKRAEVPKSDNVDRMCYTFARRILENESRLTWEDSPEDIQRIHIPSPTGKGPGYRALLMHGDELGRNGFASPTAWRAAANRWRAGAYKWKFQDLYLGHYHTDMEMPIQGRGKIYWTGSTESDNRYARDSMAEGGDPSQRLHFIDSEKSRVTAKYQIWLD